MADNELHRFVLEAAGSGTRQWPIYVDALRREDELRRDLSKRIFAARDGAGEVRMGSERSKFLIGHALNKLARGLQWVRNGNRIADDALSLWEPRIGLSPFEFDRKLVVTEFQFGPDFLCSIGADRFGQRWHVSFLGRVHFAIAYLDMTSWWRHATRWLAHTRR